MAQGDSQQPAIDSPETTVAGGPVFSSPAPDDIIQKAQDYVVELLGEDYFRSHFSFKNTFKVTDYSYAFGVEFWYNIPYEADISSKIALITFDKEGRILTYRGPKRAYTFAITKEQAIEAAQKAGVEKPEHAQIIYAYSLPQVGLPIQGQEEPEVIDSYVWFIEGSLGEVFGMGRQMTYIDVDTGEVLGFINDTGIQ